MFEPGNAEYADLFVSSKLEEEKRYVSALEDCMAMDRKQPELTDGMRRTLIDWLTEVVEEYSLQSSTLFLSIHIIDRLLQICPIKKHQFQLLGSGCLLIAAKMEEVTPPTLANLAYISEYIFDEEALVLMEQKIMSLLMFDIYAPTRYFFAMHATQRIGLTARETSLVQYLLELSLQDLPLNMYPASVIAGAAIHLSLQMLRFKSERLWSPELESLFQCHQKDLVPAILRIRKMHWEIGDSDFQNTIKKFKNEQYHRVSELMPLPLSDIRFDKAAF